MTPRTDREAAARALADFLDDAASGPWHPEGDIDGDGLKRRRDTIWLTNDDSDSLQVDEDHAALLVNAALHAVTGPEEGLDVAEVADATRRFREQFDADDLVSQHEHDDAGRCRRCVAEGRETAARTASRWVTKVLARHHREVHVTVQTCSACRLLGDSR
jgi:hypothetical protein